MSSQHGSSLLPEGAMETAQDRSCGVFDDVASEDVQCYFISILLAREVSPMQRGKGLTQSVNMRG